MIGMLACHTVGLWAVFDIKKANDLTHIVTSCNILDKAHARLSQML